jgi:hypothetical protein
LTTILGDALLYLQVNTLLLKDDRRNYRVDDVLDEINNVDAPAMAAPGQEMMACEEGEGMRSNTMSFAIVVVGCSNGLIQTAQGQWRSITM